MRVHLNGNVHTMRGYLHMKLNGSVHTMRVYLHMKLNGMRVYLHI